MQKLIKKLEKIRFYYNGITIQTSQTLRVFANETSRVLYSYSTPKIIEKKIIIIIRIMWYNLNCATAVVLLEKGGIIFLFFLHFFNK